MKTKECTPWFIAIGASGSDGLNDLRAVLRELPASLDAVVLIVLHRPWDSPSQLRAVLGRESNMQVVVARDGERFEAGTVYIGEPAEHLTLAARSFGNLVVDPDRNYGNRTVDLLFKTVATHGHDRMIGVILSGSLDDGSRGLAAISHAGGITMALTPDNSAIAGMPKNAIAFDGPIDTIGNAHQIAVAIVAAVNADRR